MIGTGLAGEVPFLDLDGSFKGVGLKVIQVMYLFCVIFYMCVLFFSYKGKKNKSWTSDSRCGRLIMASQDISTA